MIIENLTEEEAAAVEKGLQSHNSMLPRFGKDPQYLKDMDTALLGFRGYGERLAADAIYRLDYVLHPMLAALKNGQDLHLDGVTFSHVKRSKDGRLSATAVDDEGRQRFRIRWNPDNRRGQKPDEGEAWFDVTIQSCPSNDPQYEYAEGIAHAHLVRKQDRVESVTHGTLWSNHIFEFLDAMDVIRPALSEEIASMPRPRPMSDKIPYSHSEIDRIMVLDAVRLDGGLPGRLARHVISTMLQGRGEDILRSLAERCSFLARKLADEDFLWRGAALTTQGQDNVFYAVPSQCGEPVGLFMNARNSNGPYTAFLAWKDVASGTASVIAAKGGKDIFRVVEAFAAGEVPKAPMVTIDLKTGSHDLGAEVVGTAILDLALCHVRFLEDDFKDVADGKIAYEDRFERVEDFDFFIEANADFYLDDEESPHYRADL